jgi:DNA gyrase/topoisomerase IV subunit A
MIAEHKELSRKIAQIERHLAEHDEQIIALIKALKQFIQPAPLPKKRRIGF